jgi:hypothetical protein
MSKIRYSKNGDMIVFCNRCGHESLSLKEYIMHKKEQHHVRVKDTIDALQTIGVDDPPLYKELLEKFPNEQMKKQYVDWAREQLKKELEPQKR